MRRFVGLVLLVAVAAGLVYGYRTYMAQHPATPERAAGGRFRSLDGPVPVVAVAATTADVPIYLNGVGSARALNTVTVRPQVDGKLIKVDFKEGQDVKRGDVLAQIDPATFQAQLDQAIAKKAQDEAQLANAKLDLDRAEKLLLTNSGSRQAADTARANVAALTAATKYDQAVIDNARTIVGYTSITAPLDGRTGIRQIDEGNIIRASDPGGLVTITQIRPIALFFNLPQQQLRELNRAFAKGALPAEAMDGEAQTVLDTGKLLVIDNQVDQTTGTVRLKAEFPNADLALWPGQFVNVRLLVDTLSQVVVIPTAAVQRGPNGPFVYVVGDNKVALRPVTVKQQDDRRAVIGSGVAANDKVVTTGFARLSDGAEVKVTEGDANGAPPPPPPSERRRRTRPAGGQPSAAATPENGAPAASQEAGGTAAPAAQPEGRGRRGGDGERQGQRGEGRGRRQRSETATGQ